ncbi:hypothetical protein [Microcystis aeruginosa]|uniref:hypothetical protein n=1 Tax=Microcystis aeruginosa TaxID=1126 RepID=UPI001305366D|nr:hypothetical protein [Microcystis aeruginosa]
MFRGLGYGSGGDGEVGRWGVGCGVWGVGCRVWGSGEVGRPLRARCGGKWGE